MKKITQIIGVSLALAFCGPAVAMSKAKDSTFTKAQKAEIEKITHEYLLNNPEVLIEVSQALQKQEHTAMQEKAETAIRDNASKLFHGGDPVVGNKQGDVSIVEFFDYQCGYCKKMVPMISDLIKEDKNVRLVLKELPIFGENSIFAAKAALASEKQKKYFDFHRALMNHQGRISQDDVLNIAKQVGLNIEQLKADMNTKEVSDQLEMNKKLAQSIGVSGTPAFIFAKDGNKEKMAEDDHPVFLPGAIDFEGLKDMVYKVRNG